MALLDFFGFSCCAKLGTTEAPEVIVPMESVADKVLDHWSESTDASSKGCHVVEPQLPGDVGLCEHLPAERLPALAAHYRGCLLLGEAAAAPGLLQALEAAGMRAEAAALAVGLPSSGELEAALAALEGLPRPALVVGAAGLPAALLLLQLAGQRGYSKEAVRQLGSDLGLALVTATEDPALSSTLTWMLERLPAHDALPTHISAAGLIFRQLNDEQTSTQTYLLGCRETKEAVLIDPVLEQRDRDLAALAEHGLTLTHVVSTHVHADHVTSGGVLRRALPAVKTVIAKSSGAKADVHVGDGDAIHFGRFSLVAMATPGHTGGCTTWRLAGDRPMLFTGDALLIRGCGRTDFQEGDAGMLYENVHNKILSLPGDTLLYPGHDYKQRNVSTVDEERLFNPRLTKSKADFVQLMGELKLPYPKRIDTALPMNMVCGIQD